MGQTDPMDQTRLRVERLILTTGGTGGHIFPALAVAEAVRRENPGAAILFAGGQTGPEKRLARAAGLDFAGLPMRGALGRGAAALAAPFRLAVSVVMAARLIRSFRPQAVVGFGGYAGVAPVLAARMLGVPTAIHEQNSVPGLANRLLGRLVDRVFLSFSDDAGYFPPASGRETRLTGNPVRAAIFAAAGASSQEESRTLRLLVFGGSQGARALNRAVLAAAPALVAAGVNIRHQTGPRELDSLRAEYSRLGLDGAVRAEAFIEDMAGAYGRADLVLCRAGASSVFELAAAGKPSVLVPFPYATHDHQTANARRLSGAGAAWLLPEPELAALAPEALAEKLTGLLTDRERLAAMSRAALSMARPRAAEDILAGVREIIQGANKA